MFPSSLQMKPHSVTSTSAHPFTLSHACMTSSREHWTSLNSMELWKCIYVPTHAHTHCGSAVNMFPINSPSVMWVLSCSEMNSQEADRVQPPRTNQRRSLSSDHLMFSVSCDLSWRPLTHVSCCSILDKSRCTENRADMGRFDPHLTFSCT